MNGEGVEKNLSLAKLIYIYLEGLTGTRPSGLSSGAQSPPPAAAVGARPCHEYRMFIAVHRQVS